MRKWILPLLLGLVLSAFVVAPDPASAMKARYKCTRADLKVLLTGQGDSDGDGVSDCREIRYLRTFINDPDSDDDGLDDGEDFAKSCDPLDPDSDDDGIEDGDDRSPVVKQKMQALLDALSCPTVDAPGSIGALGTTAVVDLETEFDDVTCSELSDLLLEGGTVVVKIEILENALHELRATEIELEFPHREHDDDDDDDDHGDDD